MFNRLMPDLYVPAIYDIDIEKLQAAGIRAVLTDIDNTLAPYSQAIPTAELLVFTEDFRIQEFQSHLFLTITLNGSQFLMKTPVSRQCLTAKNRR